MKQCPACHRTYAEETTFCLDDGSTLVTAEPGAYDAPPTAQIPDPRATGQPMPPYSTPQPYYNQPRPMGFKLTNRILGLAGGALLLIGNFLPIISIFGLINFSLFTFVQGSLPSGPRAMPDPNGVLTTLRIAGIVMLLLSAGAVLLAWKNMLKPLIAIGAVSLGALVFTFIKLQSLFSEVPAEVRMVIGIGWGFFVMVAAAVLLIVAGVKKEKDQAVGGSWNSSPPVNYP